MQLYIAYSTAPPARTRRTGTRRVSYNNAPRPAGPPRPGAAPAAARGTAPPRSPGTLHTRLKRTTPTRERCSMVDLVPTQDALAFG